MRLRGGLVLLMLWLGMGGLAWGQGGCKFGGPKAEDHFEKTLKAAKSCKAAEKVFIECAWGSSADGYFGLIPMKRCERDFLGGLSVVQRRNYQDQLMLCSYEYARQDGSLYRSEASMCAVEVAARFAANPRLADVPLPRASFDCAKAATRLELAICSDRDVGKADVVLGRVYAGTLASSKVGDKAVLVANERAWLKTLPDRCAVKASGPFSASVFICLKNEIEIRFTILDGCNLGDGIGGCLDPESEQYIREGGVGDDGTAKRRGKP